MRGSGPLAAAATGRLHLGKTFILIVVKFRKVNLQIRYSSLFSDVFLGSGLSPPGLVPGRPRRNSWEASTELKLKATKARLAGQAVGVPRLVAPWSGHGHGEPGTPASL